MSINISTSPVVFRWRPACWMRVTGDDAASFLQGQFTNDLRLLSSAGAVYGLWLTLKGKILADSFVLRGGQPNEHWIGSYFSSAAVIRERLESHVIADDVVIEDMTAEWAAVSIVGDAAEDWMKIPRTNDCLVFRGRRGPGGSVECVYRVAAGEPAEVKRTMEAARLLSDEEMTTLRVAAGIPAIPADAGPGDLPNEAGLETDAISYTKGCYLGQEVMARLKAMGQVRRRLVRVHGTEGQVPPRPAPVFSGPRQVGEVRSAVADGAGGWIGLAMLSLIHGGAGAWLALTADGPANVRPVDPT